MHKGKLITFLQTIFVKQKNRTNAITIQNTTTQTSIMKIGLALSGGGARGIMHLGVIKALQEQSFDIVRLSGTSAGAIAGALIAHGYSPDEALELIMKTNFLRYFRPSFSKMSFITMEKVEELYLKYLPHDSFEALKIPLTVCATDIQAGESVFFESGRLIRPLMASSCLPGIFEPIVYQKKMLVDGAVMNNLPIEPLLGKIHIIIGSNCNAYPLNKPLRSVANLLERSLLLSIRNKTYDRLRQCDLTFEPTEVSRYDIFDVRKAADIFKIGYQAVLKAKSSWEPLLANC